MKKLLLAATTALLVTGCVTPKSYVDPAFAKASFSDIQKVQNKHKINLVATLERNGEPLPRGDQEVRAAVTDALRSTGVVEFGDTSSDITIKVTVNNIANMRAC